MKKLALMSAIGALFAAPLSSQAAQPVNERPIGEEARLSLVSYDRIRDFRPDGWDGLWIEDNRGNWYYAEVLGSCVGLQHANAIGVEVRGANTLDKFGTIIVDGERCPLTSLVHSLPPGDREGEAAGADADA